MTVGDGGSDAEFIHPVILVPAMTDKQTIVAAFKTCFLRDSDKPIVLIAPMNKHEARVR